MSGLRKLEYFITRRIQVEILHITVLLGIQNFIWTEFPRFTKNFETVKDKENANLQTQAVNLYLYLSLSLAPISIRISHSNTYILSFSSRYYCSFQWAAFRSTAIIPKNLGKSPSGYNRRRGIPKRWICMRAAAAAFLKSLISPSSRELWERTGGQGCCRP